MSGWGPSSEVRTKPEHEINPVSVRARISGVLLDQLSPACTPQVRMTVLLDLYRDLEIPADSSYVSSIVPGVLPFRLGIDSWREASP